MPDVNATLTARSAFAGPQASSSSGRGVIAWERDGLGLATVLVRRGKNAALAQRMRESFGIDLPFEPRRQAPGEVAVLGTGPGAWIATCEAGGNAFAASLMETIGDLASISDQSDGYAVLRLSGPAVREALAKVCSIDLHPSAFKAGDVAVTSIAHIGCTLWRIEDAAEGTLTFEIALYRSMAMSFWDALSNCAVEFGLIKGD